MYVALANKPIITENKVTITEEKANQYLKDIINYLYVLNSGNVSIKDDCARIKVKIKKLFFKLTLDITVSILKLFADKENKTLVVKILDCNQYCFIIPVLETLSKRIKGLTYYDGVIYFDVEKNPWFKKRAEEVMKEFDITSIKQAHIKNGEIEFLTN